MSKKLIKECHYFLVNKPYGVLSQFTDKQNRKTLSSIYNFPKDVYPVGRLDLDSEGLIILTNDKSLTDILLNSKYRHDREYFVQVEGNPSEDALNKLRNGIIIEGEKTLPAVVKIIEAPNFDERIPPIRERKNTPTSWMSLVLIEGRNRQVRKMTAAVGFPTLRLIRVRIKNIQIGKMKSGEVRQLSKEEINDLKNIVIRNQQN
jgi:23S rRNA pseudouridine2457 synthase